MTSEDRAAADKTAALMWGVIARPSKSAPAAAELGATGLSKMASSANDPSDAARVIRLMPEDVAPSLYANRLPFNWESAAFQTLKADIQATNGNVQPIKVRIAKGSHRARYEIVYGHRRHRACFELNLSVLAIVEDLNDAQLVVQMTKDNASRHDCSSYERGVQFKRAREDEVFSSNQDLGAAVGLDQSEVATLIRLAGLPPEVVGAFRSPADIHVKWERKLSKALKENRQGVLDRAAALLTRGESVNAKQVLTVLCNEPGPCTPAAVGRGIEIRRDGKLWAAIFVPAAADGVGNRVQFVPGAVGVDELEAALRAMAAGKQSAGRAPLARVQPSLSKLPSHAERAATNV